MSDEGRLAIGRKWGQIKRPHWGQLRRPRPSISNRLVAVGSAGGAKTRIVHLREARAELQALPGSVRELDGEASMYPSRTPNAAGQRLKQSGLAPLNELRMAAGSVDRS